MYSKRALDSNGSLAIGEPYSASGPGTTLRTPQQGRARRAQPDASQAAARAGERQ